MPNYEKLEARAIEQHYKDEQKRLDAQFKETQIAVRDDINELHDLERMAQAAIELNTVPDKVLQNICRRNRLIGDIGKITACAGTVGLFFYNLATFCTMETEAGILETLAIVAAAMAAVICVAFVIDITVCRYDDWSTDKKPDPVDAAFSSLYPLSLRFHSKPFRALLARKKGLAESVPMPYELETEKDPSYE